jgi:hypothetical protein
MEIVNIRNRYYITNTWSGASTAEYQLFFWYSGQTEPTAATYIIQKSNFDSNISPKIDLSKYAKDYLTDISKPLNTNTAIDTRGMIFARVKFFRGGTEINNTLYHCLYGYEVNTTSTPSYALMDTAIPVRLNSAATAPILFTAGSYTVNYYNKAGGLIGSANISASSNALYNVSLSTGGVMASKVDIVQSSTILHSILVDIVNDCRNSVRLTFRNSFGGFSYIDTTAEIIPTITTQRNMFDFYEQGKGRINDNRASKQSYRINTGFIPEKYNSLIKSMFISSVLYMGEERINLNADSIELKTHKRDGLINYTFEAQSATEFAEY